MRVLHVTPYFAPAFNYGGPPRSILGLCKALLKVGVKLEVFTTTANGVFDLPATSESAEDYEGVPVRYFPRAFPRKFFGTAGLAEMISSVIDSYDLLHIHGLWNLPAWTASQPARKAGLPYVLSPRGMLEPASLSHKSWRKRLAYLMMERRNLSKARMLHATSEVEGQTLKSYGFDAEIVVLPNGVDVWEGPPLSRGIFRRKHGLDENTKLIVFLGRIHPIKRLDILASAFVQINEVIPNSRLVIAGPDECGHRGSLEPIFSQRGDAALWVGEVGQADKWGLLQDADVLVMCSDSESFGISVVEAMAAGLPVVVTKTCPWQEVETAGCGYWVAQESGEIARAVKYILSHPDEAQAMGERGKALASANYGWDSIARKMAACYATAAGTRSLIS
jgi:glycosyltransferase involved in cell wall biosynthesis